MSQTMEPVQAGTILEVLPNAHLKLRLENGTTLAAIMPKELLHKEGFIRAKPGDRVEFQIRPAPRPARVVRFLRP